MNYTNIKNLHKEIAFKNNKSSIKVAVKEYNNEKITFNNDKKLTTIDFIRPILKMVNYTVSWIQQYKYIGILYNTKTGEYSHKVNYEDYVDLIIGAYAKYLYYLSLEPGGIIHEKYFTGNEMLHYLHKNGVVTNIRNVNNRLKKQVASEMIDKIEYQTLSNNTKDYIKTGLLSKKKPNFVYTLGKKNIEIDDLVRDNPDYLYTLTQICDKEEYLDIMIEAINTLPDVERHKVINKIKP
jgi:hypothetical protein